MTAVIEHARARVLRRLATRAGSVILLAATVTAVPQAARAEDGRVDDHAVTAAEGRPVTVDLLHGATSVKPGTARLLRDGLPPGATLTADGRRAVIPGQGTWQIAQDGASVTFTPFSSRLGQEPTAVRFSAVGTDGAAAGPGVVTVTTPVIPDMVRAAAYGAEVTFPVASTAQNVDPATLVLAPAVPDTGDTVSQDGTTLSAPGEGTWTLDRSGGQVTFRPENRDVTTAVPIHISGRDADGQATSPALLEVGYPHVADHVVAEQPGAAVHVGLLDDAQNVRADTLRFDGATTPTGSSLSDDGRTLTVPREGTWTLEAGARTADFTPSGDLQGSPAPVRYTAAGLYADGTADGLLTVEYTQSPPMARGDRLRGLPRRTLTQDLLANDTPGAASIPLVPSSVRLEAPHGAVVPALADGAGTRITVPGEGTYSVDDAGVLTFAPESSFIGTASPVTYSVEDAAGVRVTADISVFVDPQTPVAPVGSRPGGINSTLAGLHIMGSPTFSVFSTFAALLVFSGLASLWIGGRMESERRSS